MNLNKVFVLGNLTRDPERRQIPTTGNAVVNFGLATNRFYKDKAGQRQQVVEFHNIVIFGPMAETAAQYLRKGSLVLIEGRLQTRNWDDAATGQKKYRTEIVATNMQLGPRPFSAGQSTGFQATPAPAFAEATAGKPAFAASPAPNPAPQPNSSPEPKPIINDDEIPVIQEESAPESEIEEKLTENPFEKDSDEIDVKDIPF